MHIGDSWQTRRCLLEHAVRRILEGFFAWTVDARTCAL